MTSQVTSAVDPKEIKKRLIDMDLTMADLARELGVSVQMVSGVIHGKYSGRRVREYIYTRTGFLCAVQKTKTPVAAGA